LPSIPDIALNDSSKARGIGPRRMDAMGRDHYATTSILAAQLSMVQGSKVAAARSDASRA
jgi:hypothetical protein